MTGDSELFPKPRNWSDSIFWVKKNGKLRDILSFKVSIYIILLKYNPVNRI